MGNAVTVEFKAKLDDFAGGSGYKVPKLTASHVTVAHRDTLGTMILQSLSDERVTKARLARFAGLDVPGVVWADGGGEDFRRDTSEWTITPLGNGYMARVSITKPLERTTD